MKTETLDLRYGYQLPKKVQERANEWAVFIIANDASTRQAGRKFGVSNTTIHRYMKLYLPRLSKVKSDAVKKIFQRHKIVGRWKCHGTEYYW